ncbi:BCCT family transporter [Demequina sp. NBRC 110054]|uniref:BCCT family transporter n=1 Tax=Demequina sp. NBRC 110054 TaxID=1570343 RepID=UPI0009FDD3AE|nr:BCCT family transporter [Demequina sp. NBRC 110054]
MAVKDVKRVGDHMSRAGLAKAVFVPAAVIIFTFVAFALIWPTGAAAAFDAINDSVIAAFGWYYVLIAAVFVVFVLYLGFSQYGDIVLGKDDDRPAFSNFSWYGLLFAAGMGIGLVFYGVSEPLSHFTSPPPGVEGAPDYLAEQAMARTFLHWGLHAWAIYIVVGLAVAYAVHRRGRPVSIRWTLEPLLGDRVKGRWGDVIDAAAVVGTLFGLATSLGFGVLQLSSGLDSTGIADPTVSTQVWLIVGITCVTIFSLVTGVQKGMKWLSSTNLVLSGAILIFVLVMGPTEFLLSEFVQSIGAYLSGFISMAFDTSAFAGEAGREWQSSWSTFYWGWWISWAPFVGVFIARVSKGRTVREFVWGVLLVPASLTFLWFSVLGGSAIYRELYGEGGMLNADGSVDVEGSFFTLLEGLPGGKIAIFGAMILIALFFVTSSDSGALVLSMLSTGGDEEPVSWIRVFWATTTATVAIALMVSGGLTALQTAAILTALPFSIVMIGMMISTLTALAHEHRRQKTASREEFVAGIITKMGDQFGLEPTTTEIDMRATRIRWRRRSGLGDTAASAAPLSDETGEMPTVRPSVTYRELGTDEVETVIPNEDDED